MRILIDGDATPQINDISIISKKYHHELIVYSDSHHMHQGDYQVIICDQGRDSVDYQIVKDVRSGDLVITQDYGLASYVLLKNALVLHVSGKIIDQDNIDTLLMQRYIGVKNRRANKHIQGPKKRTKEIEDYFMNQLENILREKIMKKYIFFDIDGTLTNSNPGGIVLPSTHETLRKLQENGHFVAIATGRAYSMTLSAIKETGIKNAICAGGNGLVLDGKLLYVHPIEKDKALMIINECKEKNIPFAFKIDDSLDHYSYNQDVLDYIPELKRFAVMKYIDHENYEQFEEIHKIFIHFIKDQKCPLESLEKTGLHYARYHEMSVIIEPDDKYKGILDMIHYINGNEEDIVVFGDGHNDLSMMKKAPMGIAMGNAIDQLKEAATFVTKRNDEDGIEYACKHFGWID